MGEPSGTPASKGEADALPFPEHHISLLQSLLILPYLLYLRDIKTILSHRSERNDHAKRWQAKRIGLNEGRKKVKKEIYIL
jgi:hypothetical protein